MSLFKWTIVHWFNKKKKKEETYLLLGVVQLHVANVSGCISISSFAQLTIPACYMMPFRVYVLMAWIFPTIQLACQYLSYQWRYLAVASLLESLWPVDTQVLAADLYNCYSAFWQLQPFSLGTLILSKWDPNVLTVDPGEMDSSWDIASPW